MERERLHGLGKRGVQVHVLAEAVGMQHQRAAPTWRQLRKLCRVELQCDLLPTSHDHETVIHVPEQFTHIAQAGEGPCEVLERHSLIQALVVVHRGIRPVRRVLAGIPQHTELGNHRLHHVLPQLGPRDVFTDEYLIPRHVHVGPDPEAAVASHGQVGDVQRHHPRKPRRESRLGHSNPPSTVAIGDLDPGRHHGHARLIRGVVHVGIRVFHPPVEVQDQLCLGTEVPQTVAEVQLQPVITGIPDQPRKPGGIHVLPIDGEDPLQNVFTLLGTR